MKSQFSNLPQTPPANLNSTDGTVESFNTYYSAPVELDAGTVAAMTGFFESKGFEPVAAKSIAVIIMTQARIDDYNPMTVLDSLQGLDGVAISSLATQILNFNRFKSSFLGYSTPLQPFTQVQRNILS